MTERRPEYEAGKPMPASTPDSYGVIGDAWPTTEEHSDAAPRALAHDVVGSAAIAHEAAVVPQEHAGHEVAGSPERPSPAPLIDHLLEQMGEWDNGNSLASPRAVLIADLTAQPDLMHTSEAVALVEHATVVSNALEERHHETFSAAQRTNTHLVEASGVVRNLYRELTELAAQSEKVEAGYIQHRLREISEQLLGAAQAHQEQSAPIYRREVELRKEQAASGQGSATLPGYRMPEPVERPKLNL